MQFAVGEACACGIMHSMTTTVAECPATSAAGDCRVRAQAVRLGVVSFINTLPLIDGLENLADVHLHRSIPSLLLDQLLADKTDVALCSAIDYQRAPAEQPLVILPVGLLGCDGPTLTVRLYCSKPIEQIKRVYCDTDSHTSIALLRILLKEVHDIAPKFVDYDPREHVAAGAGHSSNLRSEWPEAMLLIGDKVVTDSPPAVRYPYQMDLGGEWVEHTGMPFVFAAWMAQAGADPSLLRLAAITLDYQRRHNRERIDLMIHQRARPRHWPVDLAADYLKQRIAYDWTPQRRAGLELFFDKALQHGLIEQRRALEFFEM